MLQKRKIVTQNRRFFQKNGFSPLTFAFLFVILRNVLSTQRGDIMTTVKRKTDLRVVKTYHALNEAFLRLLEERSLDEITVNDLCTEADIRRATFYKHFSGKTAFVDYAIRHVHEKFADAALSGADGDGSLESFYLNYVRHALRFLDSHQKLIQHVQKTNMLPALVSILSEKTFLGIKERMEEESKRGVSLSASPEILAAFYAGGLYQTLIWRLTACPAMDEDEILSQIKNVIHR
jgi:AcrR family transcriptional regulator